ncbi:hypothetical protein LP422_08635 [Janibacter limosus]|uniref:Uncharacterized protein n=1 Tax=Janibacter limosus TaxID=53458 RepID=A0AC61U7K8_9MICO|nr:hypothetical protein [Janibacter limosus]UUZ45929.1 hypothetical protein LP422_08635 [Janibacter limosus]
MGQVLTFAERGPRLFDRHVNVSRNDDGVVDELADLALHDEEVARVMAQLLAGALVLDP